MINAQGSERYTIHYSPIAGGTTKTLSAEVISTDTDGTVIFRGLSDAGKLQTSIKYNPSGESQKLSISDKLTDGKHTSKIKIDGLIKWESPFEIHAHISGWRTSTKMGRLEVNIPGVGHMVNTQLDGMLAEVEFQEHISGLRMAFSYDHNSNRAKSSVRDHNLIDSVEEITFDQMSWYHDAYPFSGSSLGISVGFSKKLTYESKCVSDEYEHYSEHTITRQYDDQRTKNQDVNI